MKCPKCESRAKCRDTRYKTQGQRWRRYNCVCGYKFNTIEITEDSMQKKDNFIFGFSALMSSIKSIN